MRCDMNKTLKQDSEMMVTAIGEDLKYIHWFYTLVQLYLENYILFPASF